MTDHTSPPKKEYDHNAYMQQYRAAGKDHSTKVQNRAKSKAIAWVRAERPDVWNRMMDEAWAEYVTKNPDVPFKGRSVR